MERFHGEASAGTPADDERRVVHDRGRDARPISPILSSALTRGFDGHGTGARTRNNARNHYVTVIGRLRPSVTIAGAQSELDALGAQLSNDIRHGHYAASLSPLKEDVVGRSSRALELMFGARLRFSCSCA
jgi:hypothetical protein